MNRLILNIGQFTVSFKAKIVPENRLDWDEVIDLRPTMKQWTIDNNIKYSLQWVTTKEHQRSIPLQMYIEFDNPDDAILFKLIWT